MNKYGERFFSSSVSNETGVVISNTKGETSTAFKHGQVSDFCVSFFDWQQLFNGNSCADETVADSFIDSFFEQQQVFISVVSET
jgi:hypothetical protein